MLTHSPTVRRFGVATVLVTLALVAASPSFAWDRGRVTEDTVQTYALAADGTVELENINGDVVVEGWDRDEVELEVHKRGRSQRDLDEAEVVIDADPTRISVRTEYPRGSNHDPASVDYTLRVPRTARIDEIELVNGSLKLTGMTAEVSASTVNGSIEARGLTADVELTTVNGDIDAAFDELGGRRHVELSSVNGTVEIGLPDRADARIRASTVHGRIADDFGFYVDDDDWVGESLEGDLGSGSADVDLETVNGRIRINRL